MSREIKFRLWDKRNRRMGTLEYISLSSLWRELLISFDSLQHEFEIMQFTGLKDKNGKEIYEGDIYKFLNRIDVIKWVDSMTSFNFYSSQTNEIEVIGNIYETSELMMEKTGKWEGFEITRMSEPT